MKALKVFAGCCLFTLFSSALLAADDASCQKIRIGAVGWTDVVATTAVASELLGGLGYQTTQTQASQQIIFAGIQKQQIDVFLGYWKPIMDDNIQPFLDSGAVRVAAEPSLDDAIAVLAVPSYTAEAGLKTFADIARFKEQLDGKIYGIEPDNDGNLLIDKMIKGNQFDLGGFRMVESSEAGMLVQVQRAVKKKEPVVFLGWAPHPMNTQFDITYLAGGDDVFGPDYGAAKVYTVVPPDYEARCANVGKLLNNLQFSVEIESQLMEKVLAKEDPVEVARTWLKANPQYLDQWLAGVTTYDGQDGVAAVKKHVGL